MKPFWPTQECGIASKRLHPQTMLLALSTEAVPRLFSVFCAVSSAYESQ